uniref:ARMC5-like ARM-repeats domain-containing protein n=1 Tax=Anopheles maculatus TaxID=74869 RepID=A0A182SYJ2_9DIPT
MEEAKLASLLANIRKSSDKSVIYRNLVTIRTNFVTNDGGIRLLSSQDGIKVLVELLSKPYEKVIEVVLSILGNCCTKKECCKQNEQSEERVGHMGEVVMQEHAFMAFECGILKPLISIISNIPNPSIQCRGCRLLGNLAQHEPISYKIARDNATTGYALSTILNESDNTAVLIMVIRAIRQLWREKPLRTTLMEQGCIGKIVHLLIRYAQVESDTDAPLLANRSPDGDGSGSPPSTIANHDHEEKVVLKHWHAPDRMVTKEKFNNIVRNMEHSQLCDIVGYQVIQNYRWKDRPDFQLPTSDETVKLFESVLKCLQMITTTVVQQVIEEIYGEVGAGMHCLVYLCGEKSPFRALSLKVVSNLAANPDAIDRLTECGVIKMAADLIMYADLDDSEKRYCINMMCLLTKEACNRGHIRRSGALQSFMKIAKQSHEKREQAMILYALYQYRFDSLSNEILLSNGLVSFLVRILNGIIADREVAHIRHDEEERERATHTSVFSKRRSHFAKAGKMRRSDLLFHYKSGNGYSHHHQQQHQQHHKAAKQSKLDPYCSAPESPDSGSSGYASTSYGTVRSPSMSIGSSPPRVPEDEAFEDDTEVYSPVCSDHEQEDETATANDANENELAAAAAPDEGSRTVEPSEQEELDGAEEETSDFDMVAYLIEDNSNAKWLDAAEEKDLPVEEDSVGVKPSSKASSTHPDDCVDENEMFKIELDIATAKTFEKYPMQPTLTLLWSVSKSFPAMEFVQADTLETLLKICKHAKKPRGRAFQTLANILKHVNHFLPLLKQDFVFRLHEMKSPYPAHGARCWSCDEMRTACNDLMSLFGSVGETGYGQGEIAHILRTGERDLKLRVSIIVLFVVRDTRLLHKLLFDMKVLEMVMDFILDEGTDQQQQQQQGQRLNGIACCAITRLSQNLSIFGEEEDTGTPSEKLEAQEFDNTVTICDESALSSDEKVTFRVRSSPTAPQETVIVSKALLIEGSEVFRRMFEGDHFIESKNNEVHLHEPISADGLRYFFYLVRLQTLNKLTGMAPPPKVIEASLDALSLAQKYLLPTIEKPVLNIIKTLLNDDCVLNVFEWSLRNYNQELLVASTYYFLYSDISGAAKWKLYRAANRSCYRDEWRRLLTETILYRVQPNAEL